MKNKRIHDILERLSRELHSVDDIDSESRKKIRELQAQVEKLDNDEESDASWLWDEAKELESWFAARYPTLERIARELADAIAKMGI